MKISISEARRRLPELVRQVRKDAGRSVQITVHDEIVAELWAVQQPQVLTSRLRDVPASAARTTAAPPPRGSRFAAAGVVEGS